MNINEFTAAAAAEVLKCLPQEMQETVRVTTEEVMKINDQVLHGVSFQTGEDPAPTFYVDQMYEMYLHGARMEELMKSLADAYSYGRSHGPMPEEVPDMNYKSIKRRAGLRLLGTKYNHRFLKTVPYRDLGNGLALVCDAQIKSSDGGVFSTIITKKIAEEYNYDMNSLFSAAMDNAWRSNSASFRPAEYWVNPEGWDGKETSCWVLTTDRQRYGATALFYPGTQAMIADVLGEDYLAIPSSLHEFIIIRQSRVTEPGVLLDMLREANRTIVGPDEVLSDDVLRYSVETGELSLLQDEICEAAAG